MKWGIESGHLDPTLPYAAEITTACEAEDCPVALAYAIAWHETIQGEMNGLWVASSVVSPDQGLGLFQLTSSWPLDWLDPYQNAVYAISQFILPGVRFWTNPRFGFEGVVLVKCVAATFNGGIGNALAGHNMGNVDLYTTQNDGVGYGAAVQKIYENIVATGRPTNA